MSDAALESMIATVPPGRWAVGVSGGADSVALFSLLCLRPDLSLHVVHLDHQTRGAASTEDAEFVRQLAIRRGVPCTVALRDQIEAGLANLPANPSARYRAARMELFRRVVAEEGLDGVVLAHHADDQAETVLHRLIRGAGPTGLAGMLPQTRVGGLLILRPLLGARRDDLRRFLRDVGQNWREDASNQSDRYLRNRLRRWLADEPELHDALLALAAASRALRDWARAQAPELGESFAAEQLRELPAVLGHESARRWLVARGAPPGELSEGVLDRLIEMAEDAASAPRRDFPGAVSVRRRRGIISVDRHHT